MKQITLFDGHYSLQLCRAYPYHLFVFGDNARRVGKGGQAIIRDEPNVFGVCTKRSPGGAEHDFFAEGEADDMLTLVSDLINLEHHLDKGKRIVLPVFKYGASTLGCGLAELPMRAPSLYALINAWQSRQIKEKNS